MYIHIHIYRKVQRRDTPAVSVENVVADTLRDIFACHAASMSGLFCESQKQRQRERERCPQRDIDTCHAA